MAGQDLNYQDPYYRVTPIQGTQFVQAGRPIVLAQDSGDVDLIVGAAGSKDIVVYADLVTIKGKVTVQQPAGAATSDDPHPVATGGRVVILARRLDTLTGSSGDAVLDLTGAEGYLSPNVWTAPPHGGVGDTGDEGVGVFWGWNTPTPGGTGQSSADSPKSPLNGAPGDPGGLGGSGGVCELRCGSLASTVALGVDVSGGTGGNGLDGQKGAKGGAGGPGAKAGWYSGSPGGNGGRGGNGGDGGAPGAGGAHGAIAIWLMSGSADAVTCKLDAGAPGAPGNGADPGDGGDIGHGTCDECSDDITYYPNGQPGVHGTPGHTPDKLTRAAAGTASMSAPCHADDLVGGLTLPLTPQLAMMLDLLRVDYLQATRDAASAPSPSHNGKGQSPALDDMTERLNWVTRLANAYQPIDPKEEQALDAVRGRIRVMHERLKRGLDYFGHDSSYAPLGSLAFYQAAFTKALDTLRTLSTDYASDLAALDKATATAQQIQAGEDKLTTAHDAYKRAAKKERATIKRLIARVNRHDSDQVNAKAALVNQATDEFRAAVASACGLTAENLIDIVGQFAFLGEKGPQQAAMFASQGAKLVEAAASNCVGEDGKQIPKEWVIGQLGTVDDLKTSLAGYTGTISGINLSDPGAVKLLGEQSQLDDLCSELWSYGGARELKDAFEDYVSAVQARNADIMTLNQSLARLRGYLAGAAQATASLTEAQDAKSDLSAPGAPALISQLARMEQHAVDDCLLDLYRVSRAYWMWSLQPGDELRKHLADIGNGDPLALSPDTLLSAAQGIASDFDNLVMGQLGDAGAWFPHPDHDGVWWPPADARGIKVTVTHDTHPGFIEALRTKRSATIGIMHPRKDTGTADSPFSGMADVRITKIRAWVHGATLTSPNPSKPAIRVDLTHTGRETIMLPDDSVHVVTHPPVRQTFEYAVDKPDDPTGIVTDGELFDLATPEPATLIGPFTRWRVEISETYNDASLDISQIDQVVFEFFGHQRPYPAVTATTQDAVAAPA